MIEAVEAARAIIDAAAPQISPEVKVSYLFDDSKEVRRMLSDLGNNVGAAVIIVMVVVLATLGLRCNPCWARYSRIILCWHYGVEHAWHYDEYCGVVFAYPRGGHACRWSGCHYRIC